MPLSPEQEWAVVACGMIAHADDVLEVGEWDQIVRIVEADLSDEESDEWLALLTDRQALEKRFAGMDAPLPHACKDLLRQSWNMALADGAASEVEIIVHDRIAEKMGVQTEKVTEWRMEWTAGANARAELVVSFAAALANLDGRMDNAEAARFDSLIERMPVSVGQRVELQVLLHAPPKLEQIAERISALGDEQKRSILFDIAPLVLASHQGDRERNVFFELAEKAAIPRHEAEKILG